LNRARAAPAAVTALLAAFAVAAAFPGAVSGAEERPADARQTEAQLKALKAEIERVSGQVNHDQVERDRLAKDLKSAELSVSEARQGLEKVRKDRAERAARRAALAQERKGHEADLVRERESLANQLRAAYLIGREEPLKLLLNQKDPSRAGRMFAYYSYFGRARAEQITRISATLARSTC